MSKLTAFTFITLDGYLAGPGGDISWHRHGAEENDYAIEMLGAGNTLLFGRVTYEFMASYWPTPAALQNDPLVAAGMNRADKIVFSRTLQRADWHNTRLVNGNMEAEIQTLKQLSGPNLTLLGSGSILTRLASVGLIDEYQVMVDPVVLGTGTSIFAGLKHPLGLTLTTTRTFKSGVVLLCYRPVTENL